MMSQARVILFLFCAGLSCFAQAAPPVGITSLVLDGNRAYAELDFVRPDGSSHRALAFVDMGSPNFAITETLLHDLHLVQGMPLRFRVGALAVQIPLTGAVSDAGPSYSVGTELKVEAVLPARTMQGYDVVLDYARRSLTFALAGTARAEGIAVPFDIDRDTGLLAVDAAIAGMHYRVTIDNGSAYTWFRQDTAKSWLGGHSEWERGVGAVGASNMMMAGDGAEATGTLLRIPEISIGEVRLKQVGALAAGHSRRFPASRDLFDWYSAKNAVPVVGWIGGNALKNFRLTVAYSRRTIYWLQERQPEEGDLNQVGLTLAAAAGERRLDGIATKNGKPTVEGVVPGDKLIQIGALHMQTATWGEIYQALHGRPGEERILLLERNGKQFTVRARVTAF